MPLVSGPPSLLGGLGIPPVLYITYTLYILSIIETLRQRRLITNGRVLQLSSRLLVEATDGHLDLEPALSARYRIERVLYRGRYSIESASYSAPQPDPRAR